MRSLPRIHEACPAAITVLFGGWGTSYGAAAPNVHSWMNYFVAIERYRVDMSRVIFPEALP